MPVYACTFTSWHVPMSVSLASNVPGYEGPYNFISGGCPQRLVDDMMSCLWDMSDAAYCLMQEAMDPYCSQLDDLSFCNVKETECTWDLEDAETEAGCMLSSSTGAQALTKARRALEQWMRCMPVVSFNGGCYDLQLIKPYLAAIYGTYGPPWLRRFRAYEGPELSVATDGMSSCDRRGDEITSVLKKGLLHSHLHPRKSFFPYEYVDDLAHLRDPLPVYTAFYSSLHGKNTLEEGLGQRNYAELCRLWVCKGMTSLRDLLIQKLRRGTLPDSLTEAVQHLQASRVGHAQGRPISA